MIVGFIGGIGSGKTYNAVRDAVTLGERRGAVIVSNIRVSLGPRSRARGSVQLPVGHDGIDVEQLRGIIERARSCDVCDTLDPEFQTLVHGGPGCQRHGVVVLLDEVGILMPARFWQDFPIDLIFELSQSRKSGVDFLFTAQDVEQVDAVLRRLTQWVYMVKCFPVATIERREKGKRPWFFMLTRWKVKSIESANRAPIGRTFRRYLRRWERSYSTDELVRPPEKLRQRHRAKAANWQ